MDILRFATAALALGACMGCSQRDQSFWRHHTAACAAGLAIVHNPAGHRARSKSAA